MGERKTRAGPRLEYFLNPNTDPEKYPFAPTNEEIMDYLGNIEPQIKGLKAKSKRPHTFLDGGEYERLRTMTEREEIANHFYRL